MVGIFIMLQAALFGAISATLARVHAVRFESDKAADLAFKQERLSLAFADAARPALPESLTRLLHLPAQPIAAGAEPR